MCQEFEAVLYNIKVLGYRIYILQRCSGSVNILRDLDPPILNGYVSGSEALIYICCWCYILEKTRSNQ